VQTFDEAATTDDVYRYTVMPLVAYAFQKRGRGTCIAYGQTGERRVGRTCIEWRLPEPVPSFPPAPPSTLCAGSGKTFTVSGIQANVARDVFRALGSKDFKDRGLVVHISFLEIYGARCSDLLHARNKVVIREDGKQRVVASGLEDVVCHSAEEMLDAIARANAERATASTEVNSQSSRSHSICEISIRGRDGRPHGSLSLVDLAGSERAADSRNHNRQRRLEGAEINKSLLALKECIRALALRSSMAEEAGAGGHLHVPFRASKLTLALRDSFISDNARVVMIATVSPNAASADHTQNTLRYADRVKEKSSAGVDPEAAALLAVEEGDEAEEEGAGADAAPSDVAAAGAGGAGARGKRPMDVTFSFLDGPPGGKAFPLPAGRGGGAAASAGTGVDLAGVVPPRMSPLTMVEDEVEVETEERAPQPAASHRGRDGASGGPVGKRSGSHPAGGRVGARGGAPSRHREPPRPAPRADSKWDDADSGKEGDAGGEGDAEGGGDIPEEEGLSMAAHPRPLHMHSSSTGSGGAGAVVEDLTSPLRRGEPTPVGRARRVPADSGGGVDSAAAAHVSLPQPAVGPTTRSRAAAAVQPAAAGAGGSGGAATAHGGAGGGGGRISVPPSMVAAPASTSGPPATVDMPSVPSGGGGGFRRLLSRPTVPPAPAPAPAPALVPAPASAAAAAAVGDGDMRSKFRQRGKMVRASVGSGAAVPPTAAVLASGGGSAGAAAPLPHVPMHDVDDDMALHDDDFDAGMPGRDSGPDGKRTDGGGRLVQSFMPLPGSRYGAAAAPVPAPPPAPAPAAAAKMPSPERDLALVHALRRSELRSRGGGGDGATPRSPAGAAASSSGGGGAAGVKSAATPPGAVRAGAGAAGGSGAAPAVGHPKATAPAAPVALPPPSPELSMQLTATAVLEAQEDLLNAHMVAIQENADLLTQEGKLLAGVQSGSADDFDIDAYASKLQSLLTRKLRTTQALLGQLSRLRDQWDREEMLHKTLGEVDFDL